jgi:hypothetical protein
LVLIGVFWWRFLSGREPRLFWTLAVVNSLLLLTGAGFHNNYIPWASIWVVAAVVEAFSNGNMAVPERSYSRADSEVSALRAGR